MTGASTPTVAGPKVVIEMSMSLDGFVARTDHSTEEVHAWYEGGDVEVAMPNNELTFHVDEASAPIVRDAFALGANVTGRVTFDDAEAWGGEDPMGIPSFIVTHEVPEARSRRAVHVRDRRRGERDCEGKSYGG